MDKPQSTKYEAMKTLASAYWHMLGMDGHGAASELLHDKFHYLRRSLTLHDMVGDHARTLHARQTAYEGMNGRMPTHF